MADESKPVAAEPTAPVVDAAATETKPVESTPAATEAKPETTEAAAEAPAATAEEPAKAAEEPAKEAAKEVDPIYKGTLKYTTGNPLKSLISKPAFQFYFGEEAVKAEDLKHTVKLQEAGGRETAAWSNETGKGVLYYIRETASKTGPPGAVLLHAIEDLKKTGSDKINFKLHGTQHNLIAGNPTERDGWYKALEEKIAEAKTLKDDILAKPSFKETLEKLTKPTGPVLGTAAVTTAAVQENIPKRSAEERHQERKARSEAKKEAKAAKDRSQSRGKKFFEQFRTKKAAAAADEPKTSTEEPAKPEAEEAAKAVEEPAAATETAEPAAAAEAPAASEEVAETAAVAEEKKVEEKKSRRGSKFIDRIKALGSPTQEKKQEDAIPAVEEPAKATEEPAAAAVEPVAEAPAAEAAVAEAEPTTNGDHKAEEKVAEEKAAPAEKQERRRSSFFDFTQFKLSGKGKKPEVPAKDEPATEEAVKATEEAKPAEEEKPAEPAAEAAAPEAAAAEAAETTETKEPAPKPEKKAGGLIGLIRSGSKAIRGNRESKKAKAPAEKLEEAKTETAEEPKVEEAKPKEPEPEPKTEAAKPTEPAAIGDVVGDAVTVGTPAPASQTVTASA